MAATKKVNENMTIYEAHREPPKEALKPITAGRLKGFSDINPMWRIKALTEQFGPCGIGWYYTVDRQWLEPCGNEVVAFVNISLHIKVDEEWSQPIFGNGGSKLVAQERSGAFVSDEAYKMAVTDAIGVAAKQLGIAADVYFANDRTKYTTPAPDDETKSYSTKAATNKSTENKPAENKPADSSNNPNNDKDLLNEEVDNRLLVTADNKMSMEQYSFLLEQIKRTGSMEDVVRYAKTDDLTTISSSKCVALLTGLLKRDTKEA